MSDDVVVFPEFGPLHRLAEQAFIDLQRGRPQAAERQSRLTAILAVAADDDPTWRYAQFVLGRALIAEGRPWEALSVIDTLMAAASRDAWPFWRAKALGVRAVALRGIGSGHEVVDVLAEVWVLTDGADGRLYNQISASVMLADALRTAELYEQADRLLTKLWRVVEPPLLPMVALDGARVLAEWSLHAVLIDDDPRVAETQIRLASRAQLLRRAAPDDAELLAFATVFEALAAYGLGDIRLAEFLLARVRESSWPRRGSIEWRVATYVSGMLACTAGRFTEATKDLEDLREVAEEHGHDLWIVVADEALVTVATGHFGPHPALAPAQHMFRRAVSRWAVQQADRFEAVRTRIHINELLAERDRATRLSQVDPLTGVGNRRALRERLTHGEGPFAALFVDVDDFKKVNDAHSYVEGDAVLAEIAALLEQFTEPGDVLVRFGGDEFVLVLDGDCDETGLAQRADQIVTGVREYDWGRIVPGLAITVSVGMTHSAAGPDLLGVLSLAVRAAKSDGRNRHATVPSMAGSTTMSPDVITSHPDNSRP